jgi:hypothetical protein
MKSDEAAATTTTAATAAEAIDAPSPAPGRRYHFGRGGCGQ